MILDTNALSAWLDGNAAIGAILERLSIVKLNAISLGEYRFGIRSSRYRQDYEERLALIESDLAVLAADSRTSVHYADVRNSLKTKGCPIPQNDVWIAAIVRQAALPLLSNDTHFDEVDGIQRVGW